MLLGDVAPGALGFIACRKRAEQALRSLDDFIELQ
jgi:hypothetical protein